MKHRFEVDDNIVLILLYGCIFLVSASLVFGMLYYMSEGDPRYDIEYSVVCTEPSYNATVYRLGLSGDAYSGNEVGTDNKVYFPTASCLVKEIR